MPRASISTRLGSGSGRIPTESFTGKYFIHYVWHYVDTEWFTWLALGCLMEACDDGDLAEQH